jgi:hypothetical protein
MVVREGTPCGEGINGAEISAFHKSSEVGTNVFSGTIAIYDQAAKRSYFIQTW